MFAGIIESIGTIESIDQNSEQSRLRVLSPIFVARDGEAFGIGDSVALSGVCLTVVSLHGECAEFDVSSETIRRTKFSRFQPGSRVNIERSLVVGARVHGHFVLGHVDAVGHVLERSEESAQTVRFSIGFPHSLSGLIAEKGSLAIDGVSLTVGEVSDQNFSVYIIPHTLRETTFHQLQPGDSVNLEADCLGRYVKAALESGGNIGA